MTDVAAAEEAAMNSGHIDTSSVDDFDDSNLGNEVVDLPDDSPPQDRVAAQPAAEPDKPSSEKAEKAAKPESKDKSDGETKKDEYLLPKSRYDYQALKRREAETRASELEERNRELQERIQSIEEQQATIVEQKQEAHAAEIAELEARAAQLDEEAENLRSDGDRKGAAAKQAEIRRIDREIARREAAPVEMPDPNQIRSSALTQMREEIALEKVIDQVEGDYPALKEGDDNYDRELVDEVMNLYDAMLSNGERPAVAMERAVSYVAGPPVKAAPKANDRKEKAVERNLRAAASQPADMEGVGFDSDRGGPAKPVDIMHMSIEEYESLGIDEDKFLS